MPDKYVCTLTEASLKVAKEELHEDPKERLGSVQALREWIIAQPHVTCDTDTSFLLRFLRVSKFSQLIARRRLEGWLGELDRKPQWLRNIDTRDPEMQKVYSSGFVCALPGTDKLGRKVTMMKPSSMDMTLKNDTYYRTFMAMYLRDLFNENQQVNGIMYFIDMTGVEMKHLTYFGVEKSPQMIKLWQGIFPGRFKGFQYYNHGAVLEAFLALTRPVMSKKFSDRIVLHGNNLENVYKQIPMEMLPEEYLPDDYTGKCAGPLKGLIENFKKEMMSPEVRDRILHETGVAFSLDKSKVIKGEPEAAFRKLNIDD